MSNLKPELSEKNEYWISRHRYYELKHFCLQYPEWKRAILELHNKYGYSITERIKSFVISKPTEKIAEQAIFYSNLISLVENTAYKTDDKLALYILKGVVEERSYTYLRSVLNIPCCRNEYYELYRKFFWILSNSRK